jgi:DNA-binding NtrC family response regulator
MPEVSVLIVEDKQNWRDTINKLLQGEDCRLICAHNAQEAKCLLGREDFDVVITNMVLEEGSLLLEGLEVLNMVRELGEMTPCLVLSEVEHFQTAVKIHNDYRDIVHAIMTKTTPWMDPEEFLSRFRKALRSTKRQRRQRARRPQIGAQDRARVRTLVREARLEEAIEALTKLTSDSGETALLAHHWNDLRRRERKRLVSASDARVERAEITQAILDMLDRME